MIFKKREVTNGEWLKASEVVSGTLVTLAPEAKESPSSFDETKTQTVAKVKIKGFPELKNVRINLTSVNALVEAFGEDSKNWIGKVLTAQTEKAVVAGKRVTILYFVPEGFEVKEDSEGYVKVLKVENLKTKNESPEEEIDNESLPF